MDDFFWKPKLITARKYKPAEEAYRNLFYILEMGHNRGIFPAIGSSNMLDIDIGEHFPSFSGLFIIIPLSRNGRPRYMQQ